MRIAIGLVAVLAILVSGCDAPEPEACAPLPKELRNPGPLRCEIRGDTVWEEDKTPKISVAIINETADDIYIVGCLDGSMAQGGKGRYPLCHFEVIRDGVPLNTDQRISCPVFNPLEEEDFVKVAPGESFDPFRPSPRLFGSIAWNVPSTPGSYIMRFVYSTASENSGDWRAGGNHSRDREKYLAMFKLIPKVEACSQEFAVTVLPKK
jgi:hypothetical protein